MISLPENEKLDVSSLAGVFQNTTNSYKFYWFLAILDILQEDGTQLTISKKEIALRMLSRVWYPLDYFKLSFGAQDGFKQVATFISSKIEIDNRLNAPNLLAQINQKFSPEEVTDLGREINKNLIRWVPFRFIRPFFSAETQRLSDQNVNSAIEKLSNELFDTEPGRVMYRISAECIQVNPLWVSYFQKHSSILRGFIFWHLVKFIQKNNPNVIGLTEKLEKPVKRDLNLASRFWKGYLAENPDVTCIYSDRPITSQNLSLDHFLPWSYVAHDQLWNIIPVPKTINFSKGNCLPSFELYFERLSTLQYGAVQFYREKESMKMLEDYDQIFKTDLRTLSIEQFSAILKNHLLPHFQTARNLGFSYPYIYDTSFTK